MRELTPTRIEIAFTGDFTVEVEDVMHIETNTDFVIVTKLGEGQVLVSKDHLLYIETFPIAPEG